jgi:hypothetical protein
VTIGKYQARKRRNKKAGAARRRGGTDCKAVAMRRERSIRARLERLESVCQKQAETAGRRALIEMGFCDGESHLVMTSSDARQCWFQVRPGPGPQLADFGEFAAVLYLTPAEMEA